MKILAYGEDSLTLWALTTHLSHILKWLQDDTDPADCMAFYRPSFGRSGGPNSPQFGEFDAILITRWALYLIESKWDNASNSPKDAVVLEEVQTRRHTIFTWLRSRWNMTQPGNWEAFRQAAAQDFKAIFPYRPLANAKRLLSRNLGYLLKLLMQHPEKIRNVLLYFHRSTVAPPKRVVDGTGAVIDPPFDLICLPYSSLEDTGFFEFSHE